jgi:hypothetical protein
MLQSPLVNEETAAASPHPSPWVSIWFSPRRTIRRIVDSDAPPNWWPVIGLVLLVNIFAVLEFDPPGAVNLSRSFMPVAIGAAQTIFAVLVGPFLLAFVGSWLGGEADPSEIRQAIAWGYAPVAVAGLCYIPIPLIYGRTLTEVDTEIPLLVVILTMVFAVGAFWSVVTQVITLAEVQRFSIVRAIASMLILVIPTLLLGLL